MQAIQAEHPPFHASEASDSLYKTKLNVASFFLIGTFLGVIFFIGAGSVLYFRMYTDLTNEQEKYITITKIGLTETEMKRSATIQLAILSSYLTLWHQSIRCLRQRCYKKYYISRSSLKLQSYC